MSVGEVVPFDIKPKTLRRTYKRHHYTITFIPKTKKWKWTVEVITRTQYSEIAETQQKAMRAAEKCIDKIDQIRTGT